MDNTHGPAREESGLIRCQVLPAAAWRQVEPAWTAVFDASRSQSFFMSPEWVGAWLATFGDVTKSDVLLFDDAGEPVGAAILASRLTRIGLVPVRQLYFHTAGEPRHEGVAVEHVFPLAVRPRQDDVFASLMYRVRERDWDELLLSGVDEASLYRFQTALPDAAIETEWRPTYQVDLNKLRASHARYESVLSKNSRDQLRRSLRLYGARGEIIVRFAATADEAHAMLGELAVLHRQRWEERGEPGAFATARWRDFHTRLIERAFPRGGVQLIRVSAGDTTIGLLYNFVQGSTVSFYQSGFRYEDDNKLKPGLVTHAVCIQACLDMGFDLYDFLAGDPDGSRYKGSLSTHVVQLAWSVLRRPTARTRLVAAMRRAKHRLVRLRR